MANGNKTFIRITNQQIYNKLEDIENKLNDTNIRLNRTELTARGAILMSITALSLITGIKFF